MILSNIHKEFKRLFSRETNLLNKLELLLLSGLIILVFIPIKYVFPSEYSSIIGTHSDFTAITLYLSQLLTIGLIALSYFSRKYTYKLENPALKALLVLFLGILVYFYIIPSQFIVISAFFYLKLSISILLIFFLIKSQFWLKYKDFFLYLIICFGAINAIIAIIQFLMQRNIGINLLGESPISILQFGVAKIVTHETTFIRSYGLFPHPNILSGLLVIVSLLNLYLLNKVQDTLSRGILISLYVLNLIGLFFTFSRGGLLATLISTLIFLLILLWSEGIKTTLKKYYFVVIIFIVAISIFSPWLQSRATISDEAVNLRSIYNSTGYQIFKENWLLGTGPGTNLLHMKQKLGDTLEIWDVQPIHNYFLLIISELGIIGVIILLFYFFLVYKLLRVTYQKLKNKESIIWQTTLLSILMAVLILMMIDHYFYTNWPAQILLCFIISWVYTSAYRVEDSINVSRETNI